MATLNFPDSPDTGDTYSDANSGFEYEWNGTVWISKNASTSGKRGNIQEIDDISGAFNGSNTDFILNVASNAIEPTNAQQLVISVGGVLQNSGDDYTIVGSTITFTTAPADGLTFFGTYLNPYLSVNTVADNTVSTGSLAASGNYTVGGINVTGVSTLTGLTYTGISSIGTLSSSNLAVTGVGTIANVIHTKDSSGLGATMGAAVGVVTYLGDGSNLSGIGLSLFPYSYDPGIGTANVDLLSNIAVTWNNAIEAGSGTITIREGSVSGTVIDQFVVGTSNSITFANQTLTLNPAVTLGANTSFYVTYPAGSIKSLGGQLSNSQVVANFDSRAVNNQLWGWGEQADHAHLGQNSRTNYSSPVQIPGTWSNFTAVHANLLAINTDGELFTTGQNNYGQVGDNSTTQRSSPVQIGTETTWSTVNKPFQTGGGNVNTRGAFKTDGTLWVWGRNDDSSLGLNDAINRSSPCQLAAPSGNWDKFHLSAVLIAGLKDGKLYMAGRGSSGALGQNDRTKHSSPIQVGTDTTWANIALGDYAGATFATKTNGTLWSWGYNNTNGNGQLGHNNNTEYSSPTQIGTGTNWATGDGKLTAGNEINGAIKTDGTLWTWGSNSTGSCGVNVAYNPAYPGPSPSQPAGMEGFSSPVQVPGTTWDTITQGGTTMWAQKTDGTQWGWGNNNDAALGLNDRISYSSPVQIMGGFRVTYLTNGSVSGFDKGGAGFKGV